MEPEENKVVLEMEDGDAVDRVLNGGDHNMKVNTKEFAFDSVFAPEAEQKHVFNEVGKPVLKDVLAGYNGAILAYGQTGAGKTHTLLNNAGGKPAEAGLLPRTVAALFVYVGADAGHVYTVDAAAFQIYNEQVDDLLCEDRNQNCNLPVKAGGDVQNLTWVPCKTADELLRLFQKARNNVIYAETKMNKASSRSHSVFQIKVSKRARATDATGGKGAVKMQATFGKLTVVDLAGSERVKRSGVTGQGLKEAANINTSLLAFGNVVQALADKKKHVPFRDSKLTRILEDSVGGNCKTSLLVCCSPAAESCGETLNALEFASRAMKVETTATLNECTVVVDAARLAADLAGEGIDEAVKAKAKEMQQLQQSMAAEKKAAAAAASKWQTAAKKAAEESAAKLAEQSQLALKYKQQLQEVQRATAADQQALQERVKELEAMVQQAQEGHEAKARVVQLEADLATAQAALDDVRAEAAEAAAAAEAAYAVELGAMRSALEEAGEEKAEDGAQRAEVELKLATVEQRLREVCNELRAKELALEVLQQRMDAEAKRTQQEHRAEVEALEAAHAERLAQVERAFAEEAAAMKQAHLQALQQLDDAHAAAVVTLQEQHAEGAATASATAEQVLQEAMAAKAKEIAGLEAELAGKDAAIGSLLQERTALEARVEAERAVGEKRERATRLEMEAALRSKDEDKENAMLHQASLRQAQAEAHLQETAALAAEAALRERRQGGAFAAARSLLALRMEDLAKDMKTLQKRFDRRESRSDDVARIRQLERELRQAQALEKKQWAAANQLKLQLDNRDNNDLLFGGIINAGHTLGNRKKPSTLRAANRLEPLLGVNPTAFPSDQQKAGYAHPATHQAAHVSAYRNVGPRYINGTTGFKH